MLRPVLTAFISYLFPASHLHEGEGGEVRSSFLEGAFLVLQRVPSPGPLTCSSRGVGGVHVASSWAPGQWWIGCRLLLLASRTQQNLAPSWPPSGAGETWALQVQTDRVPAHPAIVVLSVLGAALRGCIPEDALTRRQVKESHPC